MRVMTLRKAIKFNAKKCLKNNWGRAILILVILTAVNLVLGALDNAIFSAMGFERVKIDWDILRETIYRFDAQEISPAAVALSLLLSLIRLCIMAPLALGAVNWALELSDGRSNSIGELFWAFDNAAWYRSVWMRITVAVKTGLFSFALEAIPTVMVTVGRINLMENRPAGVTLILIGGVLAVAAAPVTMWFGARYFAVDLLLCDRYYYTVREATKLSVEMTKGHRWQIVGFYLSFIPWYLLCCLIVPLFYVVPYVAVASTMLARYYFEDYLLGQNKLDVSDPDKLIIDDVAPEDYRRAREEQGMDIPPVAEEPAPATEPEQEDNGGIAEL